jgi:hypothetical protein
MARKLVGIDFDNTIIHYSEVFRRIAADLAIFEATEARTKDQVRAAARKMPDGELVWQKIQAIAYGSRIMDARPADGIREFLVRSAREGIKIKIISHKTTFAACDEKRTNLREAAMLWLRKNGIFDAGCGLVEQDCIFANSRNEKIGHIISHGCSHFIDDLIDVFTDPLFPNSISKFLYLPEGELEEKIEDVNIARSWHEISNAIFRE